MPKIPSYQNPQVTLNPLQGGQRNVQADPSAFGLGAANALGRLGDQASSGILQAQQDADIDRTKDALSKVFSPQVDDLSNTYLSVKGENIFKQGQDGKTALSTAAIQSFDEAQKRAMETLANDRQKQYFQRAADSMRAQFYSQMGRHEANESMNYRVGVQDSELGAAIGRIGTEVKNGVVSEESMILNLGMINSAVEGKAKLLGWDKTRTDLERIAAFSQGHAIVLEGMIQADDPAGAQKWLEDHKGEIDIKVYDRFKPLIQSNIIANEVQSKAVEISKLPTLEEQLAEVDKATEGKADFRVALRQEVEHRFSINQRAQQVAEETNIGKLWDMRFPTVPGQRAIGPAQIEKTKEWAALDGKQRNILRAQWEQHTKRNENDPATIVAQFATYQRFLDDPKALVGMNDEEIMAQTGNLGSSLVISLLKAKREAAGDLDKLNKAVINDIPFKDIVSEYGNEFETKGKKGDALSKALAMQGQVRNLTIDAIKEEQQQPGKKSFLTPERKEEILRGFLTKVKTRTPGGGLFGWFDKTSEVPLYQFDPTKQRLDITTEERDRAYKRLKAAAEKTGNTSLDLFSPANYWALVQAEREGAK